MFSQRERRPGTLHRPHHFQLRFFCFRRLRMDLHWNQDLQTIGCMHSLSYVFVYTVKMDFNYFVRSLLEGESMWLCFACWCSPGFLRRAGRPRPAVRNQWLKIGWFQFASQKSLAATCVLIRFLLNLIQDSIQSVCRSAAMPFDGLAHTSKKSENFSCNCNYLGKRAYTVYSVFLESVGQKSSNFFSNRSLPRRI